MAQSTQTREQSSSKDKNQVETGRVFKTLFESLPDIAFVLNRDLQIKMINRPIPIEGRQCYEILFNRSEPCEDCEALKVFQDGKPLTTEKKVGEEYFEVNRQPIFGDAGQVEGVLEVCKSVTRTKDLELQLYHADKLSSIGQLVSGIVHEINNPTMFIRGNLEVLSEAMKEILPILDEHARNNPDFTVARLKYDFFREHVTVMLQDMVDGANRIKFVIGNLKRFARKDEGLMTDEVDLNCVVTECLRLAENPIKRTAQVHSDLNDELPVVIGNRQKLVQVIVNMLINAGQAIEKTMGQQPRKGNVWVTTRNLPDSQEISLEIADDGCGMDETVKQKLFTPFFTTKRETGGTGLGLPIASRIIDEHQGRIELKSQPGQGTSFTIILPARKQNPGCAEKE